MSRKSFKYDWQWHQLERNIFVSLEGANTRFPRFIDCTMRLSSPRSLHGKLRIGSRVAEIAKCAWIPRKNPGPPLEIPTFPGLPRELPNESLHSRFVLNNFVNIIINYVHFSNNVKVGKQKKKKLAAVRIVNILFSVTLSFKILKIETNQFVMFFFFTFAF